MKQLLDQPFTRERRQKYLQQKIFKVYRTAVLANSTGAVLVMLWEDI